MIKTSEKFNKAYNSLVRAYHGGTLMKGYCGACAVGNIVTDACGGIVTIIKNGTCAKSSVDQWDWWYKMFHTAGGKQSNYISLLPGMAEKLEKLTGYTAYQMARMEYLFETNSNILGDCYPYYTEQQILEDQYNGLSAVVDYLLELEGIDNDGHKEKLQKHPKLQLA